MTLQGPLSHCFSLFFVIFNVLFLTRAWGYMCLVFIHIHKHIGLLLLPYSSSFFLFLFIFFFIFYFLFFNPGLGNFCFFFFPIQKTLGPFPPPPSQILSFADADMPRVVDHTDTFGKY